jgi:hypothetical protein
MDNVIDFNDDDIEVLEIKARARLVDIIEDRNTHPKVKEMMEDILLLVDLKKTLKSERMKTELNSFIALCCHANTLILLSTFMETLLDRKVKEMSRIPENTTIN